MAPASCQNLRLSLPVGSSVFLEWICSLSTLGKHLRKLGSILASLRTPK
uniref:Uncharacterized protein n=1 Tax=Arundo donax TaxID=35708 RepID=A0A0A8ZTL6_ARUDO